MATGHDLPTNHRPCRTPDACDHHGEPSFTACRGTIWPTGRDGSMTACRATHRVERRYPVGTTQDGPAHVCAGPSCVLRSVMGECRDDLCGPGGDRLSRVLRHSTMGAETFDGRVRDGIGSCRLAKATRPAKIVVGSDGGCIGFRVGARPPGVGGGRAWINEGDQAERAISTGQLHALLRFHTRPIDVVVFHGSSGRTRFEVGFELRCLQLLSRPHIATLHCGWRHNRSTRGAFVPVLSY